MNREQANSIDAMTRILPGGQGHHDFWLAFGIEWVQIELAQYTEAHGGSLRVAPDGQTMRLVTAEGASYLITGSEDGADVATVTELYTDRDPTLYWDKRRVRVIEGTTQRGNANQPFLSDWEMSQEDVAEDAARIRREQNDSPLTHA